MGIGLTSKPISHRIQLGYIPDNGKYFSRTSDTDFDNMDAMTLIYFMSSYKMATAAVNTYPNPFEIYYDTTNDTGFSSYHTLNVNGSWANFTAGDGSGAAESVNTDGANNSQYRFSGSELNAQKGSPFAMTVCRFDATVTSEMIVAVLHSQGITFSTTNNDAANLGAVGTNTSLKLGNGVTGTAVGNDHTIHKVSLWKSALSDEDILKLGGLTGDTIADKDSYNENFHMASRFKSYSDIGVSLPDHEWDFTIISPTVKAGTVTTIADTGNTGGKPLAATGSPLVGRFVQY